MKKYCNINPISKYIRIAFSLVVIGLGIYLKSWLWVLGVIILVSAFTGTCSCALRFDRKSDFDGEDE